LVEQCPFKAWVAGSNPAALTTSSDRFRNLTCVRETCREAAAALSISPPGSFDAPRSMRY
jgi:hypothetical protein